MYDRILVALDGSLLAEEVLHHVAGIAVRAGSEVILLRVAPPVYAVYEDGGTGTTLTKDEVVDETASEHKAYLERVADRLKAAGMTDVKTTVEFGDPAEQIVDYAAKNRIDLIAMSTHGRTGIGRWVHGSVAGRVLQAASVPILLIRSKG